MIARLRQVLPGSAALQQNALALIDQGVISATRLLLSILVGRALGAEGLGHYALALTLVYLVEAVVETLATLPYTVLRRQSEAPASYAGSVLLLTGTIGLGLGVLTALGALGTAGALRPVLFVLALALPARALAEAARRFAFAHERVRDALALDLALAALLGGGALALWALGQIRVTLVVALYGLGSLLPFLVWWMARGRARIQIHRARFASDVARNWRFGRWVLGTRLVQTLRMHGVPWALAAAAGAAEVGLFDAAGKVVGLAVPVLVSVANVLTPRVARALHHEGVGAVRRVILLTTVALVGLTSLLVSALTLGADLVMGFLYGSEFLGQRVLVGLFGLGLALEAIGIAADSGLWAIDRPHVGFWIGLAALAVLVAVAWVTIPVWGAVGAAAALAAASGAAALLQLGAFLHLSRDSARPER